MDDLGGGTAKLDVVIGVDFGTSSTKVVMRVPSYAAAFAVPFDDLAHKSLKYLLPTRLYIGKDGRCSLEPISGASVLTDMKVGLMENPPSKIEPASGPPCDDAYATVVTAAYLALVLQYVRGWFATHKSGIFDRDSLNWSYNIGIPAAVNDDEDLQKKFDVVGKAAWIISKQQEVTIDTSLKAIFDIKNKKSNIANLPDLELIPEVIVQVAGYARSQSRNKGLHLLVDIGASTLDVCSFNLHEKGGEDHYPILTADVKLLGAKELHAARIQGANSAVSDHAATLIEEEDPGSKIPNEAMIYVPPKHKISDAISSAEEVFKSDCKKIIWRTLNKLRIDRHPLSPCWTEEKFPVFACGGGKSIQVYQEIVAGVEEWLQQYSSSPGVRLINLPKPEALEAEVDEESYHRLAVAWGLSYESFNIGTYCLPTEIDDVPPPPVIDIEDKFIGKDQV